MKKKIISLLLVFSLCLSCFAGCSLLSTNTKRNLKIVVAEVNISDVYKAESESTRKNEYATVLETEQITKQDVIEFGASEGSSYSGETYTESYENFIKELAKRSVILQYEMMYYFELAEKDAATYGKYSYDAYKTYIAEYNEAEDGLYDTYKWSFFLDEDMKATILYYIRKSFNSTIDTNETSIIAGDEATANSDLRAVPTSVNTETDEFYDADYRIYTGFNDPANCSYKTVDDSTKKTRQKAYNVMLSNFKSQGYIEDDETSLNDVENLSYFKYLVSKQYKSGVSQLFKDTLTDVATNKVVSESYIIERYNEILSKQTQKYNASYSDFQTDFEAISETSSVLYTPDAGLNYGYVYNILLPFSTSQSDRLSQYKNNTSYTTNQYYNKRKELLAEVTGTDQRSSWFGGVDDYAYKTSKYSLTASTTNSATSYFGAEDGYLFFENNLNGNYTCGEKTQYKTIEKYVGKYAYNGTVSYDADKDKYTTTADKLKIDDFIAEMEAYLEFCGVDVSSTMQDGYNDTDYNLTPYGDVNYSKFIYLIGNVDVGTVDLDTLLYDNGTNKAYTAMSAMNELQFAYTTDTGVLNKYLGYSVSPYTTNYVKEFEYAAQQVVAEGIGSFAVVATDYGWHIIYCTYSLANVGNNYTFNWTEKDNEGTFSNLFYNSIKDTVANNFVNGVLTDANNVYNKEDSTVTIYENRYNDWKALDNQSK